MFVQMPEKFNLRNPCNPHCRELRTVCVKLANVSEVRADHRSGNVKYAQTERLGLRDVNEKLDAGKTKGKITFLSLGKKTSSKNSTQIFSF